MKNKIKQFSKGEFTIFTPDIVFPETHIQFCVGEGEVYQGSFSIENRKDGNIRGLVYPSSFRMRCLEQGFDGSPVKIHFTYDSTGLQPGDIEHGKFTIVCNGGEYDLSFTAVIEKPFIMTSYGKVQSLVDFRKLAMKDFEEARRLFRTRQFYDVLKYEEKRIKNLYDNMRRWSLDEQALEEFLVAIKQKEKIFLTLSAGKREYSNVLEDKKDWIEITKNTWGFLPIRLKTVGEFLKVKQTEITTDDFVGSIYRIEYLVKKEYLHAGYNYGKIQVETPYETLEIDIDVHQYVTHDEKHAIRGMIAKQGLKEYLACISGRQDVNSWVDTAIERVKQLREIDPENEYYTLLQAHIYLRGRREEEAKWILENGNFGKFAIGRKAELNAYYLFLTALLKKDAASITYALDELNRLYIKHPYSWQLLCMIINLEPKYRNYADRLRVLERQFFNGSNQVLLYAEAYLCYQENVPLLRKMDSFEIQILNFAAKYKIITRELAIRAAELIMQQKNYNVKFVRILERIYTMYDEPVVLQALCTQLIKGNCMGGNYFNWYEKAVEQELKIAQLYEYYMMSVDENCVKKAFPRIIYLYFMHGIHLDYKKTALLYENILSYEDPESEIYKHYKEEMEPFARKQLLKRRINGSLRVLYNRFFHEQNMSLEEQDAMYDVCHMYHVTTKKQDMKYVLVIEKDGSVRQRVAYGEDGATVYLYDKESRIVWEGNDGVHYMDSIPYDAVRMFYEMRYMELCKYRIDVRMKEEQEAEKIPLSFENIRLYGLDAFEEEEVFLMCTKRIREQESVEDDFLLHICFTLLQRGVYDKALLTYLAHFYCGATKDMKVLWREARAYGVATKDLAERIITQMLFSETMFHEEEIFADYYEGKPYFRLKQAYLAYAAYQYVINGKILADSVFEIIRKELVQEAYLAEICKAALLKYYAEKGIEQQDEELLKGFLQELCQKHMIFEFYQVYPTQWLRGLQLHDKVIVEYHAQQGEKVKITYQIDDGIRQTETLLPMYENAYIKEFILYEGETLRYCFNDEKIQTVTKGAVSIFEGKYGKLNHMTRLQGEKRKQAMQLYQMEEEMAQIIFQSY